jgi:alkylated DNA repair dioxygenase AlkB
MESQTLISIFGFGTAYSQLNLFSTIHDSTVNLLPYEGTVNYFGVIFSTEQAGHYFDEFMNTIAWRPDEAVIFGKHIITKRKVAWYGDSEFEYTYSGKTKTALPWTTALLELKNKTEQLTGEQYNSCLLNLYHTGEEGMAWHSDGEKELKEEGAVASLSFGAERKFSFRHKVTRETVSVVLEHGSLLVMKGTTQKNWLHRLPPTTRITRPRVNLTFRMMVPPAR